MSGRVIALALGTLMAAAGLATSAGTTLAAGPSATLLPGQVQTLTVGGASDPVLALRVDRLYPGVSTTARFLLRRGPGSAGGTYAVAVTGVRDLERGCGRPEVNAGDVTCGAGDDQGELSGQLLVGHRWTPATEDCAATAPPTVGVAMGTSPVALAPPQLSALDEVCLVVGLILPLSADNLVQSDLAQFDLRLGLQDATRVAAAGQARLAPELQATSAAVSSPTGSPTQSDRFPIAGTAVQPEAGSTTSSAPAVVPLSRPNAASTPKEVVDALLPRRSLPYTGTRPLMLLGWGAVLLVLGMALVQAVRRPQQ